MAWTISTIFRLSFLKKETPPPPAVLITTDWHTHGYSGVCPVSVDIVSSLQTCLMVSLLIGHNHIEKIHKESSPIFLGLAIGSCSNTCILGEEIWGSLSPRDMLPTLMGGLSGTCYMSYRSPWVELVIG